MPLIVKDTAVEIVCPRFGDHVDDPSSGSAVLSIRTRGDHLEFLHGIKSDVDRRTLTAGLLAKETVVIVPAVEADVVENATLACEIYFVAVRALCDGNTWRQRQKVFEFSAKDRCVLDRFFVDR